MANVQLIQQRGDIIIPFFAVFFGQLNNRFNILFDSQTAKN